VLTLEHGPEESKRRSWEVWIGYNAIHFILAKEQFLEV
jgi:hypothetical protein